MDRQELNNLKKWFSDYCRTFIATDPEDRKILTLKEEHTRHVCGNMVEIARDLLLDDGLAMLAETVALFHDVGRFPQYRDYHTFRDSASVNHAALGAKVLIEERVLKNVPKREQDLIIRAVTLHNVFAVPEDLDPDTLLFVKMVRDADKLDIWRIFMDYYNQPQDERTTAIGLDLPDSPGYSAEVLASVLQRKLVLMSKLKTLNDFKLLQLAWIFDLNFRRSLQLVAERKCIDRIAATLPATEEIRRAVESVSAYVKERS